MNKPKIDYPCEWSYTVIGQDEALLRACLAEIFCSKNHCVEFSKKSGQGKYISLVAKTRVACDEERVALYDKLRNHPAVKMVL